MGDLTAPELRWMKYRAALLLLCELRARLNIDPKLLTERFSATDHSPVIERVTMTWDEFVQLAGPHPS